MIVRLYSIDEVVVLTLLNSVEDIEANVDVFEAILADILKEKGVEDLYVIKVEAINDT